MVASIGFPVRVRTAIAVPITSLLLVACMSWQARGPTPKAVIVESPHVRLVLTDGRTMELRQAATAADTVTGWAIHTLAVRGRTTVQDSTRVSVPLDSVAAVETWRYDAGRTTAAVGGLVVLVLVTIGAIAQSLSSW